MCDHNLRFAQSVLLAVLLQVILLCGNIVTSWLPALSELVNLLYVTIHHDFLSARYRL